eukprot:8064-Ditylum_brightwellii.AAC.1
MTRHTVTARTTQHTSPLQDGVSVHVEKPDASVITANPAATAATGQGPSRGNHIPHPSSNTGYNRAGTEIAPEIHAPGGG